MNKEYNMIGREIRELKAEMGWIEKLAWRMTMLAQIIQTGIAIIVTPLAYGAFAYGAWYIATKTGIFQ